MNDLLMEPRVLTFLAGDTLTLAQPGRVLSGTCIGYVTDGRNETIRYARVGHWVGTEALIDSPLQTRWVAQDTVAIAMVDASTVAGWKEDPPVYSLLLAILRQDAAMTARVLQQNERVHVRLDRALTHMADMFGVSDPKGRRLRDFNRSQMALLAGATRETTSRHLTQLALSRQIEREGRDIILKPVPGRR